ncbi:hypothetical protein C8Q74DRAFT_617428 [Fomes fomentarius]|nr:hypothetical protein C8Q74DRAFT_617428 [Fomes fomentarius]
MSSLSGPKLHYRDSRVHPMYYGCRNILPSIRDLATPFTMHDLPPRRTNYASVPQHKSFIDMGHSVDRRQHRRWDSPPTPYTRSRRSYRSLDESCIGGGIEKPKHCQTPARPKPFSGYLTVGYRPHRQHGNQSPLLLTPIAILSWFPGPNYSKFRLVLLPALPRPAYGVMSR